MVTIRRAVLAGGLAALALMATAAAVWWFAVREDAQLATSAPAIPSDLQQASAAPASESAAEDVAATADDATSGLAFQIISERSEAAYFADEKLANLPLPSTAKGSTTDIEGTFYLTPDGIALDTSVASTFTVDLTTLTSDKEMRDNRVQRDGLQTGQYPTATFTAASVTGYDPAIAEGEEQTLQLTGIMDLHGVQEEITWEVKARRDGDIITALATVNFDYADFGIPVLNVANFVSVEDDVTLQVQIVTQAA